MTTLQGAFVVAVFLQFSTESILILLNLRASKVHSVPSTIRAFFDESIVDRSRAYTIDRLNFALLADATGAAILLGAVLSGALARLERAVSLAIGSNLTSGVLFALATMAFFSLVSVPLDAYREFVIERRHGFSTTTPRIFLLDLLKSALFSVIVAVPVLYALFALIDAAGAAFWVFAAALVCLVEIVITMIYPLVIAPLFNTFTPIADPALADRLKKLAADLSFPAKGIFVMDGSRRSRHANAYFTGIGRGKRIVLYDTMVASMNPAQIEAVLAHEIGHRRLGHITKRLVASVILLFAAFFVASRLFSYGPLFSAFGFESPSPHALLVTLALWAGPALFFLTPVASAWSRRHEYQADRFAKEAVGSAQPLISALIKLHGDNLGNLSPHRLYSLFHYSHPTLAERLSALSAAG